MIKETDKTVSIQLEDDNVEFEMKIVISGIPQVQIKTHGLDFPEETYFNVSRNELKEMRKLIDLAIDKSENYRP